MGEGASEHQQAADQLLSALRAWGAVFGEFSRQFGVHHGLHGTDASALVHIVGAEERGEPLTQAELSRLIGLTTGATSSLLNRLEVAGHVERRRDRADRRVVTLRSTALMHHEVEEFFAAASRGLSAIVGDYSARDLARTTTLLQRLTGSLEGHLTALHEK